MQATEKISGKLGKSLGAGLSALTSGGRDFYVLEYRSNSATHKAGEKQEIIVNYVEIGRDSNCAIRFTDADKFVSRKHCAVSKEGNDYFLSHLSATNPTLLNGKEFVGKVKLNSGDEIQLASDGPRLGFIVPANNKTGSLGFTRRLSLFGKQALRPYKQAVMGLAAILVLAIGIGGYVILRQGKSLDEAQTKISQLSINLDNVKKINQAQADSMKVIIAGNKNLMASMNDKIKSIQRPVVTDGNAAPTSSKPIDASTPPPATTATVDNKSVTASTSTDDWTKISGLINDVYYIEVDEILIDNNGDKQTVQYGWSGTGFLCNDGRFITARHCIEPWFMIDTDPKNDDENDLILNAFAVAGAKVQCVVHCYSPSGKTFDLQSSDFHFDRSQDEYVKVEVQGNETPIECGSLDNGSDFAWAQTNYKGNIKADPDYSHNMHPGTLLTVLGYPLGLGATDLTHVSPMYSQTMVANYSTADHALIIVSNKNTDHGNSGGPLFALVDGEFHAVALVSGTYGSQDHFGRMVPVYNVYQNK